MPMFGMGKHKPWGRFEALGPRAEVGAAMVITLWGALVDVVEKNLVAKSIEFLESNGLGMQIAGNRVGTRRHDAMLSESLLAVAASLRSPDRHDDFSQLAGTIYVPALRKLAKTHSSAADTQYSDDAGQAHLQMLVRWAYLLEIDDPRFVGAFREMGQQAYFESLAATWLSGAGTAFQRVGAEVLMGKAQADAASMTVQQLDVVAEFAGQITSGAGP